MENCKGFTPCERRTYRALAPVARDENDFFCAPAPPAEIPTPEKQKGSEGAHAGPRAAAAAGPLSRCSTFMFIIVKIWNNHKAATLYTE